MIGWPRKLAGAAWSFGRVLGVKVEKHAVHGGQEHPVRNRPQDRLVARLAVAQRLMCALLLDRNPGKFGRGIDQAQVGFSWFARLGIVDGKRTQHTPLRGKNRRRPAGAQSKSLSDVTAVVPQRIGVDVRHNHTRAGIHRGSTGTSLRPDGDPFDRADVINRQAGRRAVPHGHPVLVEQEHRARAFQLAFHQAHEAREHGRQRAAVRNQFQHAVLASAKRLFPATFGDVA